MSKILKNQTGSPILISDVGISVPASPATYTINVTDYLLWAASSNLITQIGNGNIVVNDGATDLSISDGTDLIKGQFPSSIRITDGTDTALVTSNGRLQVDAVVGSSPNNAKPGANYSIITAMPNLALANNVNPATTVYTYTGSGRTFYTVFKFNNANILLSVWKDGVERFEFNLIVVDDIKDLFKTTSALPYLHYNDTARAVSLTFPNGYEFSTSFAIKARSNDSNTGRVVTDYIIGIEKDS